MNLLKFYEYSKILYNILKCYELWIFLNSMNILKYYEYSKILWRF